MKNLSIVLFGALFLLVLASSCHKDTEVDCGEGVFITFENQTELKIDSIKLENTKFITNDLSGMASSQHYEILNSLDSTRLNLIKIFYENEISSAKLFEYFDQVGCYKMIIKELCPDKAFCVNIKYEIQREE